MLFWGMVVEFKGKIMLHYPQESEMTTEFFTTGIKFYVYIGLG